MRSFFACNKNNLAPKLPSLRYALEPVNNTDVCRIGWCGPSAYSADDLLLPPESSEEKPLLTQAGELLLAMLAAGPRTAEDCLQEGKKLGIGKTTLYKARNKLGIISGQQPNQDGSFGAVLWQLPAIVSVPE